MEMIYTNFVRKFNEHLLCPTNRKVGIEIELPIVQNNGETVGFSVVQNIYRYLSTKGFNIVEEDGVIAEVWRISKTGSSSYQREIITTDLGYSTLEVILPPFDNLFTIHTQFNALLEILLVFCQLHQCRLLGYGIHPLSPPTRKLITPKQRYYGLEKIFHAHHQIPESQGTDAHLWTVSAGNQCHIDVTEEEAVRVATVLNFSSGLQIALHANSPIWKGKLDRNSLKATREMFYDYLFQDFNSDRHGVMQRFDTLEDYINHLIDLPILLVQREGGVIQINDRSFREFLSQKKGVEGTRMNGEKTMILPSINDLYYHNTLSYFNARLVPAYGTIEVRMCCQQPPNETMVTAALNLGLIENLDEAEKFVLQYDWQTWQTLRTEAIQKTMQAKLKQYSIPVLVKELLQIAEKGLKKRSLGEELFLEPLWQRCEEKLSPADKMISTFQTKGLQVVIKNATFKEIKNSTVNQKLNNTTATKSI